MQMRYLQCVNALNQRTTQNVHKSYVNMHNLKLILQTYACTAMTSSTVWWWCYRSPERTTEHDKTK